MERLLGILTSRWTSIGVLVLIILAARSQSELMWYIAMAATGIVCLGMAFCVIPAFRELRQAWRGFPNTPEYKEHAERRDAEITKNDKNKIELK